MERAEYVNNCYVCDSTPPPSYIDCFGNDSESDSESEVSAKVTIRSLFNDDSDVDKNNQKIKSVHEGVAENLQIVHSDQIIPTNCCIELNDSEIDNSQKYTSDEIEMTNENSSGNDDISGVKFPTNSSKVGNPIRKMEKIVLLNSVCGSWMKYRHGIQEESQTWITQFKLGIIVCVIGIIALIVCISVGLNSSSVVCKRFLTVGTILGGAITAIGGIWMTVAQPTHISKTKILAVVAGLVGIGGLITTTMDQIKDWCPEEDSIKDQNRFESDFDSNLRYLLVGGKSDKYGTNHFLTVYTPSDQKFSIDANYMPFAIEGAIADKNRETGKIMIVGGYNYVDQSLDNAFTYDLSTGNFTTLTSLSRARNLAAGGWIDSETFIICGGMYAPQFVRQDFDDEELEGGCEGYNPGKDTWTKLSTPPYSRAAAGYVINDHKLFIFGGFNNTVTNHASMYDHRSGNWTAISNVPGPRNLPAAVLHKNKIIICGGFFYRASPDCQIYYPNQDKYQRMAPMIHPRYAHTLLATNDARIIAIGGLTKPEKFVREVEMFDGKIWQEVGELDFGISYTTAIKL